MVPPGDAGRGGCRACCRQHANIPLFTHRNDELQAMRGAEAGLYCAPLRLLAMEVADACNADGTFCTLITGAYSIFCQKRSHIPLHGGSGCL